MPETNGDGLLVLIFTRLTVAVKPLTIAARTTLHIATLHVELAFDDGTIVARLTICAPVFGLVPVTNARNLMAIYHASLDRLRSLNLFGPALNHRHTTIDHFARFINHSMLLMRPDETARLPAEPTGRDCTTVYRCEMQNAKLSALPSFHTATRLPR